MVWGLGSRSRSSCRTLALWRERGLWAVSLLSSLHNKYRGEPERDAINLKAESREPNTLNTP